MMSKHALLITNAELILPDDTRLRGWLRTDNERIHSLGTEQPPEIDGPHTAIDAGGLARRGFWGLRSEGRACCASEDRSDPACAEISDGDEEPDGEERDRLDALHRVLHDQEGAAEADRRHDEGEVAATEVGGARQRRSHPAESGGRAGQGARMQT